MSSTTAETTAAKGAGPRFGDFGVAARPSAAVEEELAAALAQFAAWERENTEHHLTRKAVVADNREVVKEWNAKHPGRPLTPDRVPGAVPVPPPDSPVGRKFHALHYTIERLRQELEAAKKAESRF